MKLAEDFLQIAVGNGHARNEHADGADHGADAAQGLVDQRRQGNMQQKEGCAEAYGQNVDVADDAADMDFPSPAEQAGAVSP